MPNEMARPDDLLALIRQPLLDRVDRRLAVILAISIAIHLGIAIVAWLGDPPVVISFGDTRTVAVIDATDVLDTYVVPPAPDSAPGPGAATPVAPHPAPATAVRRRGRPHVDAGRPIDAQKLVSDAFADDGLLGRESRRRSPGRGLEEELARAKDRGARIGDGTEATLDPALRAHDGADPILDGPTGPDRTRKGAEHAPPPRLDPIPPPPGTDFDPTGTIKRLYMEGLRRCYLAELRLDGTLRGRVDLRFTIAPAGTVSRASATGLDDVADCVARLARRWTFPVAGRLNKATEFRLPMIFVPG